jgi:dipeptidyl aminopeptidase/acylaminoacyl peptidase
MMRHTFFAVLCLCIALTCVQRAPAQDVAAPTLNDPQPLVGPLVGVAANDRIYLVDVGNSQHVRALTFPNQTPYFWGFAPDGCRILYTLGEAGQTAQAGQVMQAYTANLDGTDARPLIAYAGEAEAWGVWEPTWSPVEVDGVARVAFTLQEYTTRGDGTLRREYHVAWVDANAAPQAPTLYSASGDEFNPQWSPDGAWLAYIGFERRVPGADINATAVPTPENVTPTPLNPDSLLREADLWVIEAAGGQKYRLTYFDVGSVRAPRWSPDGELIAFTYSPSAGNDQFWMIANQPAAIPTQLNQLWSLILDTTWLPDSSAMLSAVRDFRGTAENRLWTIPLLGNADSDAQLYAPAAQSFADYPRFSADGRWLVLRSGYALTLVDLTTGASNEVAGVPFGNSVPFWSGAGMAAVGEMACG